MIIGLVVGGILVGQDLVRAAAVRAQITQIEKYQTAVNTFREKYDALPGDMKPSTANNFGFASRTGIIGQGDGNGVITGRAGTGGLQGTPYETGMFWVDLSQAGLIEGSFITLSTPPSVTGTGLSLYFPPAKLGQGNYVYVFSDDAFINFFGVQAIVSLANNGPIGRNAPGMTVRQAYDIDRKLDDGLPESGKVEAAYVLNAVYWCQFSFYAPESWGPVTTATVGSLTTCVDNNGATGTMRYSIGQTNGNGVNCDVVFQFQ